MKRTITIDDQEVTFVATAKTPLLYKQWTGADLFLDLNKLQSEQSIALEVFSRLAYVMARQADSGIGDMDEWLDGFGMFSLYSALPQLADMWSVEMQSTSVPKKKVSKRKES